MELIRRIYSYVLDNAGVVATRLVLAVVMLAIAYALAVVLARGVFRSLKFRGRGETLAPMMSTLVKVLAIGAGAVMALDHVGVNVGTVLAGAGVIGLAVGFGAQTLVKDCISGFFLIFDHVIAVGDWVEFDGKQGLVERVGLRITQIRNEEGVLWYVPNGRIEIVGNHSREWIRAVAKVALAYEQDTAKGLEILQQVGNRWAREHQDVVLEPPVAQGIVEFNASDLTVRLVAKIKPKGMRCYDVERDLRRMIKEAFDEAGVEIPFPRQVSYEGAKSKGNNGRAVRARA